VRWVRISAEVLDDDRANDERRFLGMVGILLDGTYGPVIRGIAPGDGPRARADDWSVYPDEVVEITKDEYEYECCLRAVMAG
jgi:hypothetical protein